MRLHEYRRLQATRRNALSRDDHGLRRSLIFHCYPKRGCDWRAISFSTFRYRDVFTGRLIVSLTTGADCDSPTDVIEWFRQFGPELEYRIVANDPTRGLNSTFRDQLRTIQHEPGIVFKAHTKGISHAGDPFGQWRENMARGCLCDIDFVEQKFGEGFRTFGVYRTFSPEGAAVMGQHQGPWRTEWPGWHFPGAFFWFDPSMIPESFFELPEHYYENEAFPCHLGPLETSFALKPDNLIFCSANVVPYFKELTTPLCEQELIAAAARGHL